MSPNEIAEFLRDNWPIIGVVTIIVAPITIGVMRFLLKTQLEERDSEIRILKKELELENAKLVSLANQNDFIFYQKRPGFLILEEQLKDTNEIWLLLFTGSVIKSDHSYKVFFKNKKVRLILLNPFSTHFPAMCELFDQSIEDMTRDILGLTELAQKDGVEVRWFGKPIGAGILISNPSSLNPWLRIEFLIPFGETSSRPVIKVDSKSASELIPKMMKSFETMWNIAGDPLQIKKNLSNT